MNDGIAQEGNELAIFLNVLRKRYWIIILASVLGIITSLVFILNIPPRYQAKAILLINVGREKEVIIDPNTLTAAERLGQSIAQLATTTPVLEDVRSRLAIKESTDSLRGKIKVTLKPNTQLLEIKVTDRNPQNASQIANALALSMIDQIKSLLITLEAETPTSLAIVEQAQVPTNPTVPTPAQQIIIAIILSIVFAFGLAFFIDYLDSTITNEEDVAQYLKIPCLGVIGETKKYTRDGLRDQLLILEELKEIRTNILFAQPAKPYHSLLITSTRPGEGKTAVAVNLAKTIADTGQKVILIDANLRTPAVHQLFGYDNFHGLSNYLSGEEAEPLLLDTYFPGFKIIPSGPIPENPSELLLARRIDDLMHWLFEKQSADFVLIDTPAVGMVTDAAVLSKKTQGVILVIETGTTRRREIKRALSSLQRVGANVIGAVLNKQKMTDHSYYPVILR